MADLTPEELATMLEELDAVCQQAQDLSAEIRRKMLDARRADYQADDVARSERRAGRKKR